MWTEAYASALTTPQRFQDRIRTGRAARRQDHLETTVDRNGQQRTFGPLDVDALTTYSNGRTCPAGGTQATITLGSDGLR
jgi:hypothetical protein